MNKLGKFLLSLCSVVLLSTFVVDTEAMKRQPKKWGKYSFIAVGLPTKAFHGIPASHPHITLIISNEFSERVLKALKEVKLKVSDNEITLKGFRQFGHHKVMLVDKGRELLGRLRDEIIRILKFHKIKFKLSSHSYTPHVAVDGGYATQTSFPITSFTLFGFRQGASQYKVIQSFNFIAGSSNERKIGRERSRSVVKSPGGIGGIARRSSSVARGRRKSGGVTGERKPSTTKSFRPMSQKKGTKDRPRPTYRGRKKKYEQPRKNQLSLDLLLKEASFIIGTPRWKRQFREKLKEAAKLAEDEQARSFIQFIMTAGNVYPETKDDENPKALEKCDKHIEYLQSWLNVEQNAEHQAINPILDKLKEWIKNKSEQAKKK